MKKLWAKKLWRGCAIPAEEQAFVRRHAFGKGGPCLTKSLSSGLIYSPVFISNDVHEIAALSFGSFYQEKEQ